MLRQRISSFLLITLPICILSACFVTHTYALTVSPARIEIAGDPGTTVGGSFALINEQSTAQTFYASYENFSAQGETGAPAFSAEKTGLDTWLAVAPTQVTVLPGQAVTVPYSIQIPATAEPGGYFAAIFWSSTPPNSQSSQVSIGAKVGVLILLSVNGEVKESAGITAFNKNGHGFFYSTLPVTFSYKFHNDGGDRVQPVGNITVRDTLFFRSARVNANQALGNILPNSTRAFTVTWLKSAAPLPIQGFFNNVGYQWKNFALGLYSAHLDLLYGKVNMHTEKTVWFFVFPWQLVLLIVIGILIVWKGGKALLTRYNRYIIKKAESSRRHSSDVDHI